MFNMVGDFQFSIVSIYIVNKSSKIQCFTLNNSWTELKGVIRVIREKKELTCANIFKYVRRAKNKSS